MRSGVSGLTRATIRSAPSVCQDCVWWQSRGNRTASKDRWIDRVEEEFGEWGTLYLDEGGRFLGSLQYGPSHLFPRSADLPAGPASDDAVLVTCSYVAGGVAEWARSRCSSPRSGSHATAVPRRSRRSRTAIREGESVEERFLVHRTVFPRDFLDEFGFVTVRVQGRVELCRLELGGLEPIEEGRRAKVLRVVQEAFTPAPAPVHGP